MISQWLSNPQSRVELWPAYLLACLIGDFKGRRSPCLLVVSIWFGVKNIRSEKTKDKTSRTHVMGGKSFLSPGFSLDFKHQLKSDHFARSKSVHPVMYSKHRGNVYSKLWQQHVMRFKDWEAMPYPRWAIAWERYQLQWNCLNAFQVKWITISYQNPVDFLIIFVELYHGYTVDLCRWTMRSWWKALFYLL